MTSRRVRGLVVAVWAVLLAHFAATFLWTAPAWVTGRPDDAHGRETSPAGVHRVLESVMTPVFAQNWSLFAPEPLHVDYALEVRGLYAGGPGGGPTAGPWIDTTAVEVRALTGHVLPAATERLSRRLASDARTAYVALPTAGRDIVLRPPVTPQGADRPDPDPWPGLRSALLDAGAAPAVVDEYLAADRALAAYATQVLRASHGEARGSGLVYVQARIVRREVAPQGSSERPEPTRLTVGARPPVREPGQDDAAFGAAWDALRDAAGPGGRSR